MCASASALAAVPVVTGKIATGVSNASLATLRRRRVYGSAPYEGSKSALAATTASIIGAHAGVTLSLVKFRLN
jgi:hypothetical protein